MADQVYKGYMASIELQSEGAAIKDWGSSPGFAPTRTFVPYTTIASVEIKRSYFLGNVGWLRIVTNGGSTHRIRSASRRTSKLLEAARKDLLERVSQAKGN